jgi:UDP-N-acetylglucosamine diphosphorylase/glucosamine-1-phosphate N-acetyltransferase
MTIAIVFDDGESLGPLTDLRPSFAVRTGALATLERLALILKIEAKAELKGVWAPDGLAAISREQFGIPVNDPKSLGKDAKGALLVNGRCAAAAIGLGSLEDGAAIVSGDSVVAARLTIKDARAFLGSASLPKGVKRSEAKSAMLLEQPWDVIRFRDAAMEFDLEALATRKTQALPPGVVGIHEEQVHISPEALIYPGVVLDAEHGRIVIDDGATIRPGSVIVGPAYIGAGSTVIDRALIKGHTAIGPVCKVAGEVGGTILQGYANKAHDGHLGDSWVGEWANFGAGTTNSNLLNTYGEVIAQASNGDKRVRTGLKFLGCIVGDHVKFAILTRIMTGSVFGTGSMIAKADAPTCVGRFEWITEERRQRYRWEKFVEVAEAAMARRKMKMSASYAKRLKGLVG